MHNDVQEMPPGTAEITSTEPTSTEPTSTEPTSTEPRTATKRALPFVRGGTTTMAYGAVGVFAFDLYAFGPALALLRPELHLSYGMIGVHSAVFSGGVIMASLLYRPAVRAFGRRRVFWGAALGMALGSVIFALAYVVALSLAGAVVMGTSGTVLLTASFAVLSDRYGARREQALVEANIGAGVCGVTAPLILAGLAQTAATWRVAMVLPVLALAGLWLYFRRLSLAPPPPVSAETLPPVSAETVEDVSAEREPTGAGGPQGSGLSGAFWLLAVLVGIGSAAEFCVVYFGTELLSHTVHLSTAGAGAALSLFYAGLLVGRIIGGHLTRRPGRGASLVLLSLAVMLVGFVAFWLSKDLLVAFAGLFVTGIGVANLYPLSLALALAAAPGRTDAANAQVQLVGGVVSLTAPLVLGALADAIGIGPAFVIEPILIVTSVFMLRAGLARSRAESRTPSRAQSRAR
jgi:MFS family permease